MLKSLEFISFACRAMPNSEPKKKVAYLFGAGATHAELANLLPDLPFETGLQKRLGLLISDVSRRVINRVSDKPRYLKGVELVTGTKGSLNIELLIGLIENSKIHQWDQKTRLLKSLVQKDIETILTVSRRSRFYLHKALFEFHRHSITKDKEDLIGVISLNYDDVLDQAYEQYCGEPNYCFSLESDVRSSNQIPLLKLHGSFNWKGQKIRGRKRTIEIIPLGASKNYLHVPYGFIWNRALEVLIECDTLRVIGCSLSQNDAHLVDLLFKAHLERDPEAAFDIEIVSSDDAGERIRKNYGFFPGIKTLTTIEGNLIAERDPPNPFKTWLASKSGRMLGESVERTRYLNRLKK
jgi:hypothetical protein